MSPIEYRTGGGMAKKQLASLLVIVVWIASFVPFGNSVYNPSEGEVQQLGGERPLADPPASAEADAHDED
jgi:hypothetical protein